MQHRFRFTSRWTTLVIVVLLIAAPAAASVITQNFLRADISASASCFVKAEGSDSTNFAVATNDPFADVSLTNTIVSTDTGVTLLQELVTVTAYKGDRITYTDVVRYRNNCDYGLSLRLVVEDDPAGNGGFTAADWSDKSLELYISKIAGAGSDFTVVAEWDASPIEIDKGDATPTNGVTGSVTVAAGAEVQSAFVIEVDEGVILPTTATLRYTAEATAIP